MLTGVQRQRPEHRDLLAVAIPAVSNLFPG